MSTSTSEPVAPTAEASKLLRGRDILCFAMDWSGDPLSRTHMMRLLSQENRILWVNSIGYRTPTVSKADVGRAFNKVKKAFADRVREVEPNLFVLHPLAIPVYDKPWVRRLNKSLLKWQVRRAMKKLGFKKPVNWTSIPTAVVVAGQLGEETLIYHCVDEYAAFSDMPSESLLAMEAELCAKADLVVVSAEPLRVSKSKHNPNTVLVRHGVDFDHFRKALDPSTTIPEEAAGLPHPIIGFFGLVADWVDVDMMAHVAEKFPHGSLVILGKVATDVSKLTALPNVHMFGRKPYSELPHYCKNWDVALMPFRINTLTLNANPLKVREYLAAGLPVVSTAIPEVEVLGVCRIASEPDDFVREVHAAINESITREERSDGIRQESWAARLDEIRSHLAAIGKKGAVR